MAKEEREGGKLAGKKVSDLQKSDRNRVGVPGFLSAVEETLAGFIEHKSIKMRRIYELISGG